MCLPGHDTSPDSVVLNTVLLLEPRVLEKVVDEGAIVAVHGTAEETDEGEGVQPELSIGPGIGRLLDQGLLVGLVTLDDLGVDDFL